MDAAAPTGLTLVVGPANSGKMGRVLDWWQQRLPLKPVVVLPTVPDARETSGEMARRAGGLVGQSAAVTFDGLVRLVTGRDFRYAGETERMLLAWRVLRKQPVAALDSLGHLPAQAVALATLLQQLSEGGKTPEEVDEAFIRWQRADRTTAALAGGLRSVAAAYRGAHADLGLTDRAEAARQALTTSDDWRRPVALYGFTSFTPGQRDLVEALSRRTEVLLAFTHRPDRAVGLVRPDDLAWWQGRAVEVVETAPDERTYASEAIAFLERHFMSVEPAPSPPTTGVEDEGVRFSLASGRRGEVEAAALRVARLLRSGYRPGEIGVVVRQMRGWSGLVGDVFDSCHIAYQMDDRRLLGETGLGHALLKAVKGAVDDDSAALFSYLRSPFSGVDIEDVDYLEARSRRAVSRDGGSLARVARGSCREALEGVWALVGGPDARPGGAGGGTEAPGEPGSEPDSAPGHDVPVALVQVAALATRMFHMGARGAAAGDRDVEQDARALRAMQAAVAMLIGQVGGGATVDGRTLMRLLAQVGISLDGGDEVDAVQVLSAQRARARRFEAVIVMGLVEGEFPCRPDTPSLLSGSQRARLDQVGGSLFTPEPDQEEALFASAASRARRLLVLSARDSEDDGSEAMPSRFWHTAKTLLGVEPDGHLRRTLADLTYSPDEAPTARHYLRGCADRGLAPDPASPSSTPLGPIGRWRRPPARLTAPAVLADLAKAEWFSPSGLESYAGCPFAWFVERVLRVKELDLALDARALGDLLHKVLNSTYRSLGEANMLPLGGPSLPAAEEVAFVAIDEAVWSDRCPGTVGQRRLAAWRLRRMVGTLLTAEARATGSFVPCATEVEVGRPEPVDVGGLSIRGRIDRVDSDPSGDALFVIDYKSGGIPAPSALGSATGLQLPLYLMALSAERPKARVVGGAYLSLERGRRAGVALAGWQDALGSEGAGCRIVDEGAMDELFEQTRAVALAAADGMRSGDISPRPDRECPPWCKIGPACRARRAGYKR